MKFVSDIPFLYLILLTFASIGIAFYLYQGKEKKQYSSKIRWVLIALRALGLALIGILFLGIFMQTTHTKVEKPILINLIDNSQSMNNYTDSAKFKKQIENYLSEVKNQLDTKFTIKNYTIGNKLEHADTLNYNESSTDLSSPFTQISEQFYGNNIGAVVLISDGNYNHGDHPLYATSNLNHVPVFTLAVGDTIQKRDVLVKNIQTNDFVYLGNSFPVEALIEVDKFEQGTLHTKLVNRGKTVATQTLNINRNQHFYKVNFEVEAKNKGVQHYQVVVEPIQGEYTPKNNQKGFYIDVIDEVRKILILASAPHPDIRAIISSLKNEKSYQVDYKLLEDWDKNVSKYDLVIFHNPLGSNSSAEAIKRIVNEQKPLLAILGTESNYRNGQPFLGMNFRSLNQLDDNTPIFNDQFDLFDLNPDTKNQIKSFPPLRSNFGKMKLNSNAKVLFYQGVGSVAKEDAQLFFHELNGTRIGIVQGEGLWRWKLYNYRNVENTDAFDDIIGKTVQYLTTRKNNNPFVVTIPKKTRSDQPLIIKAEVYNESMQLVTHQAVSFELYDKNKTKQVYDFSINANYYTLNLGMLKAGDYTWKASTTVNGKFRQLTGELVVESNDVEMTENTANYQVLEQLSKQTEGQFYTLSNHRKLLKNISLRQDIRPIESQENTVKNLIDYWWLILLITCTFGGEWFLKKYNGGY